MKKILLLLLFFLLTITASSQQLYSNFYRVLRNTNGTVVTGKTVTLYTAETAVLRYTLLESNTTPGLYYKENVANGQYDLYINGVKTLSSIWVGANLLSLMAGYADSYGRIGTQGIQNSSLLLEDLSNALITYILGSGGGTIINLPDGTTLEQVFVPDTMIKVNETWLEGVIAAQVADSLSKFWDSTKVANTIKDSIAYIQESVTILQYGDWSTPEEYGYISGDATVYLQKSIDSAGIRKVLWQKNYAVSDTIYVNNFDSKEIIFTKGSKIISTAVSPGGSYYSPVADIVFKNGNKLTITGGEINGNESSTNVYQNGFLVQNINEVELENTTIRGGTYSSFRADNVDLLTVKNTTIDSGKYANYLISGTLQTNIIGGRSADAGYDTTGTYAQLGITGSTVRGYNISFMGKYGGRSNQNVTIEGHVSERANRNLIDLHGSINSKIVTSTLRGFGHAAISGVNENGNEGYEKHNRNRIISNCIIIQDSFWLVNKIVGLDTSVWWSAIEFGDYSVGSPNLTNGSGAWNVNNVVFDSMDAPGSRANIFVWCAGVKDTTPQMESVTLNNLSFINTRVTTDKFGTQSADSTQDAVIYFTESNLPPKQININNINIGGEGTNGIKILCYTVNDSPSTNVSINSVHVNGDITYPIYIHPSLKQITRGNTYNGKPLADVNDGYVGEQSFSLYTSASADTIELFTINPLFAADGHVSYKLLIEAQSDNVAGIDGTYRYAAMAGNQAEVTDSSITSMGASIISGNVETYRPTLYWKLSGTNRTLSIICPTAYTRYNIRATITSRTLAFWRTE